ncbi:DUF3631 domain-containing protein [Nonomuraea sp. NPDC050153]|uniref:DUF3631 domain-containing protein n=1 Tax=Nonomuraea sp. NPDC050153 TaxID=3364359 RepID=UPI0037A2A049
MTDSSVSDEGVGGATLLDELRVALLRYVILPSPEAADAVTLWIAATHAALSWEHATRLFIGSPQKRCGKSRLLDVIEATSHKPLITVNISPAALVRSIGEDPPTLMLDEADTVFGPKAADNNEDLRGIVNAGHQRNRPYIRWDAATRKPEHCSTFAMVALAGIGNMPDTIMDRSVVIRMRRRGPGESVRPYRTRRDAPLLAALRDRLHLWMRDNLDVLEKAEPEMPVEDRAADTWEPLIATADLAGGEWPSRARAAAVAFVGRDQAADATTMLSVRLLADLKVTFGSDRVLYTSTILERLLKIDDGPWADYFGRPFGPRDLAKLLELYEIKPKDVREGGGLNRKGYSADDLHDAWRRYLPSGDSATSATSATAHVSYVAEQDHVAAASATNETSATAPTSAVADVADVAHTPPVSGNTVADDCWTGRLGWRA